MPTVSVIIPVLEPTPPLRGALESVAAQTFQDFEILLVDVGGAADPGLAALAPEKIHILQQPGLDSASAKNAGVGRASGRFVAFLDGDAEWMTEKLQLQVEYFHRYPETGLLHAAVVGKPFDRGAAVGSPRHAFADLFHGMLVIDTSTVMAPRHLIEESGGFRNYGQVGANDWDLWLRIATRHPIGHIPQPLTFHHPRMVSTVEGRYSALQAVITDNQELYPHACRLHASSPARCLSAGRYRLHRNWANERLQGGNLQGAREQLRFALRASPQPRAAAVYLSTIFKRGLPDGSKPVRDLTAAADEVPGKGVVGARSIPSLIHDTFFRRCRRRVISRLHDLDDLVSKSGRTRKRILFDAVSPMSFAVFRPVFERLRRDTRLDLWFTTHGAVWRPDEIFAPYGISENIVSAAAAAGMKVDAYINTDFWDMTWLHRRTRRVHLFHGVAGKYGLDAPIDLAPTISAFDCLMFVNADRRTRYIDAGLVPDDDVKGALVGYPKMDRLVDGSLDRREIARSLALNPALPTVIYAPTWSPYSSLNAYGEEIVNALTAEGLQVIVKLHDRSYDRRERGSGGIDWVARLGKYDGHPLVRIVREADGSPFLVVADAMVSDHSSIAFEYMLLDRPIVVIDRPDLIARAGISADKVERLRAAADVAVDPSAMTRALVAALARPGRLSPQRRQTAEDLFYRPGTATDRAVQLIYRLI